MKIRGPLECRHRLRGRRQVAAGFTLTEVMISVAAIAVVGATFFVTLSQGFSIIQVARENLRATQIIEEKMETIRLYTWEQVNTSGFIPATFTTPFYAVGTNVAGLNYHGRVTITDATLSGVDYNDTLKRVTVQLTWTSGDAPRVRTATTLVSRYGLQQYIY